MDFLLAGRMLGAFAVIAAVLFGLQFLGRTNVRQRLSGGGNRRLIAVLETTMLPNSAALHVVKVAEKYVVIGRSGGYIATLCEIPQSAIDAWLEAQAASRVAGVPFGDIVARIRGRRSSSRG